MKKSAIAFSLLLLSPLHAQSEPEESPILIEFARQAKESKSLKEQRFKDRKERAEKLFKELGRRAEPKGLRGKRELATEWREAARMLHASEGDTSRVLASLARAVELDPDNEALRNEYGSHLKRAEFVQKRAALAAKWRKARNSREGKTAEMVPVVPEELIDGPSPVLSETDGGDR